MRFAHIAAFALVAALLTPAQAAIYKCRVNGQLVFSDKGCVADPGARQLPKATRAEPRPSPKAAVQASAEPRPSAEPSPEQSAEIVESSGQATTQPPVRVVTLLDGKVVLKLNSQFRYMDPETSRRVLVNVWGNPPDSAEGVLGMIMPAGMAAHEDDAWGVVITYSDDGYVSDEDANEIDYTELLRDMQKDSEQENKARQEQGYGPITLVGWAEHPHYDAGSHKIYWAQDLIFGEGPDHTLNYAIRVLGRQGVLELNAVAGTDQLAGIRKQMEHIVTFAEFTEGNRYADYDKSTDRRAAYGLAALVAGGLAAKKFGLIAVITALAVKFWKVVVIGMLGLGGLAKMSKRKGGTGAKRVAR